MRDLNPRPCPCKGPALPLRQSPDSSRFATNVYSPIFRRFAQRATCAVCAFACALRFLDAPGSALPLHLRSFSRGISPFLFLCRSLLWRSFSISTEVIFSFCEGASFSAWSLTRGFQCESQLRCIRDGFVVERRLSLAVFRRDACVVYLGSDRSVRAVDR